jgi:hypothetical protein
MRVNERLEEPKAEETLPDLVPDAAPDEVPQPAPARPTWLRLAYSIEFLVALMAVLTVWSEIGGQGHLDLMPWYTKLICVLALAWCSVRVTASLVEQQQPWNRRTMGWFAAIVLIAIAMAGITYYYHLHEESDQPDSEDTTAAIGASGHPVQFILTNDRIRG